MAASKDRKALGTGLGVLFGEDSSIEESSASETLPIGKIEPRQEQPREYFDEEALKTLSESISRYGIIQPIAVRPLPGGFYQIISGERRWRAARMAGLSEVPVKIIEADDKTTAELALVENLQREDLNPVEEAKGYKTLAEDYKMTQDEIAASVGKSRPAVANSMRLLSLCEEVLSMVERGDLSAGHARALIPIENAEAQLSAAKEVISKALSVRKTEALASRICLGTEEPVKKLEDVDYAKEVSDELTKLLGRKVNLISGKKTGKIELEFYNADDRELLIDQLKKLK